MALCTALLSVGLTLLLAARTHGVEANSVSWKRSGVAPSPVVDLGYALYRPTGFNETGQYHNFSNIRYAAPPLGALRFSDPQPPIRQDRRTVFDGSVGYKCPQAVPAWASGGNTPSTGSPVPSGLSGQEESEDCLFLDVIVPAEVFKKRVGRVSSQKKDTLAPVLFNIYGGGFYGGDKAGFYKPGGLLERSNNSFIYVAANYRLGAFGFLSNLVPSNSNSTSPNAGLLDQRLALKWVQKHIHLFGGDPSQVTIIGESAGASSVVYHTVAYGGSRPEENRLFNKAIAQSAGIEPVYPGQASKGANLFLQSAGVTSVDDARKASTETLMKANRVANAAIPFFVMSFAPGVDGKILPDLPLRLMNQARLNKNLKIIAAHNARETGVSTANSNTTDDAINNYLLTNLPLATPETRMFIVNTLYPPIFNGTLPYSTNQERLQLLRKEQTLSCSTYHLAKAFDGQTFNYIFSIPPAIHAQDLAYTYYPTNPTIGFYPERAVQLQRYLVDFVQNGDPNGDGLPSWPRYGDQAQALNITVDGPTVTRSDQAHPRCEWWNQARYRPVTTGAVRQRRRFLRRASP